MDDTAKDIDKPDGKIGRRAQLALVVLWAIAVLAGLACMTQYELTPGATGDVARRWPAESACQRDSKRPTLIMFAHPRCPCTRASVAELARLMARCGERVSARVYFYRPQDATGEWENTGLWKAAAAIPGVQAFADRGGEEHCRFGATISGEVLVYHPNGALAFRGGITAARGHEGDNTGRSAIESIVLGESALPSTPVFGCELTNPSNAS